MNDNLKYTENSIQFNSVKSPDTLFNQGPIGIKGKHSVNGDTITNIDRSKPLINAVDIDWNGADLDGQEINTTAQLLAYIRDHSGGSNPSDPSTPTTQKFYDQRNYYRWYEASATPLAPLASGVNSNGTRISPLNGDNAVAYPSYWSRNAVNRPSGITDCILYLCTALVETDSDGTFLQIVSIADPIQVSGINGTLGEDLNDREYIYKCYETKQNFDNISGNANPINWAAVQQNDYLGPVDQHWKDNPDGISPENPFEYCAIRKKKNGIWEKFDKPYLHSYWGHDGVDGDGVEYVFARTSIDYAPEVVNIGEDQDQDEYKPIVQIPSNKNGNISGSIKEGETLAQNRVRCTDNPIGVTSSLIYEWVLKRKKINGHWQNYSGSMAKWAIYGQGDHVEILNGWIYINGEAVAQIDTGEHGYSGIPTVTSLPPNSSSTGPIVNYNGTIYVWYNGQWVAVGQSSGSGGYMHMAYADEITLNNGVVTSITGFSTTSSSTSKKWIGIAFDNNELDPGAGSNFAWDNSTTYESSNNAHSSYIEAANQYKWNLMSAVDGNGIEYIFCLTKENVQPGIYEVSGQYPSITYGGQSHSPSEEEYYPLVTFPNSNNNNVLQEATQITENNIPIGNASNNVLGDVAEYQGSGYVRWTDDPNITVNSTWRYLWEVKRNKNSSGWQRFGKIRQIDWYTESAVSYEITSSATIINKSGGIYEPDRVLFTQVKISGSEEPEISNHYTMKYSIDGSSNLQTALNNPLELRFGNGSGQIPPQKSIYVGLYNEDTFIKGITLGVVDSGVVVNTMNFYKWVNSSSTPTIPNGYTHLNIVNDGWVTNINASKPNNFGDSATFWAIQAELNNTTFVQWRGPFQITNPAGDSGADSIDYEFIYKRFTENDINNVPTAQQLNNMRPDSNSHGSSPSDDDFVPEGWTDNPQGVGDDNGTFYKYEYASIRTKIRNSEWSDFIDPFPWSVYGDTGKDGDGVQYVFKGFPSEQTFQSGLSRGQINNSGEWEPGNGWQDDPPQLDSINNKFIYCAILKRINGIWESNFSIPTLWSRYVEDPGVVVQGKDGITYIISPGSIRLVQSYQKDNNEQYPIDYGGGTQNQCGTIYAKITAKRGDTTLTFRQNATVNNDYSHCNSRVIAANNNTELKIWIYEILKNQGEYYDQGIIPVTFNVITDTTNDISISDTIEIPWYVDLVGVWRQSIENGIEHSISTKIIHGLNDPNGVTTFTHIGEYIRGWAENTSQLSTSVDGITTEMSEIKQTSNKISLEVLNSGKQLLKNTQFEQNTSDEYSNWTYDGNHVIDDESYLNNEFTFNPGNTSGNLNINNIQTFNSNVKSVQQTIDEIQKDTWYILSFNAKAQNLNILSSNLSINHTSQYQNSFKLYLLKDIEYEIKVTGYSSNSQNNQLKVKLDSNEITFDTTTSNQKTLTIIPSNSGIFNLQTKGVGTITNININYTALTLVLPSSDSSIQELMINGEYKTPNKIIYILLNSTTNTKYTVVYKTPTTSDSNYNQLKIYDLYNMPGTQISNLKLYCDIKEGLEKTGIDIESGKITAKTDNFEIQNSNGDTTFSVDEDGNIVGRGNATFGGKITAESGSIIYGADTYRSVAFWDKCPMYDSGGNINSYKEYYQCIIQGGCYGYIYGNGISQAYTDRKFFEYGKFYTLEELNYNGLDNQKCWFFTGNRITSTSTNPGEITRSEEQDLSITQEECYEGLTDSGALDSGDRQYVKFIKCIGPSEIVVCSYYFSLTTGQDESYITLPLANTCKGKIVEISIHGSNYPINAQHHTTILQVGGAIIQKEIPIINGTNIIYGDISQPSGQAPQFNQDGTYKFLSIPIDSSANSWNWIKL